MPVILDKLAVRDLGRNIVVAPIMTEDPLSHAVRHDPKRLAQVLIRWFQQVS